MMLVTEPYARQVARWPRAGRHILAHFADETIVVYQAYHPIASGAGVTRIMAAR
jgi:hypothetical protein